MARPILDPFRFPPFGRKIRFQRRSNRGQGVLYQNVEPQVGQPLWIRYNIPGQYWEYALDPDANTFYRLKENPYIPHSAYFLNIGTSVPVEVPLTGDVEIYCRYISGIPKLIAHWADGTESVLATGPTPVTFPAGMTSHWKLGESGGTNRNDSIGSNHLVETFAAVSQVAGKVGNAASFNGTNALQIADNASLSMGVGVAFEFAGWVNLDDIAASYGIFGKSTAGNNEYGIRYNQPTSRFEFLAANVASAGAASNTVTANTFGAPVPGTWYFIDVYYEQTTGTMAISINRGTFDTDTTIGTGGVFNGTNKFAVGARRDDTGELKGSVDALTFKKNVLMTTPERDALYNSGNGIEP